MDPLIGLRAFLPLTEQLSIQGQANIGGVDLKQPDPSIATVAQPASNTSVGRFIQAVYYSPFSEKARTREQAVATLAHPEQRFPMCLNCDSVFEATTT
ncbi:hypothetical protein D7I39_15980 [Allopusillimonas ginsengisoli]|nr:hypothetical protein D7I39_15980 [Allopusillimonas ginsengisoli]